MKYSDQKIYRTFEEFEREELRRADAKDGSIDRLLDSMLADELVFDGTSSRSESYCDDE